MNRWLVSGSVTGRPGGGERMNRWLVSGSVTGRPGGGERMNRWPAAREAVAE
jgi:hypothetical protein